MRRISWHCFALVSIFALVGVGDSQDRPRRTEDVGNLAVAASRPACSGQQTVTVTLAVASGWHIHANPTQNSEVAGAETVVTVTSKGMPVKTNVVYPPGKELADKILGKHMIYEGKVIIQAI